MKLHLQSVFFHDSLKLFTPVTSNQQTEFPERRHHKKNHVVERQPNPTSFNLLIATEETLGSERYNLFLAFVLKLNLNNILLFLPLAPQPAVGFGLSNNVLPFFPICYQLSPSSHSQHLKISFCFLFPSFPGSSPSTRPFQFLSEDMFGHPILLQNLNKISCKNVQHF